MDYPNDIDADVEYLKSLPKEEAERRLHARGVAISMTLYQNMRIISPLAMLIFGSDKIFDRSTQSLGDIYLDAYLAQPIETRTAADAVTHCLRLDFTNAQTAAILMSKLDPVRTAAAAEQRGISVNQIEVALMIGIAELMDAKQMIRVQVVSMALTVGTMALKQVDRNASS